MIEDITKNFSRRALLDISALVTRIEKGKGFIANEEYVKDDLNRILYTIEKTLSLYL